MTIENNEHKLDNPQQEKNEIPSPTLDEFLEALQSENVAPLSAEEIRDQLNKTGNAIMTRDFVCGIRISRIGSQSRGYKYRTWTTNALEDPNHPLTKKFGHKDIII